MAARISRRRAITIVAAMAGVPVLLKAGAARARLVEWQGTTLGAPSTIQLYHHDEGKARAAIAAGLAELARLEAQFSLYRADSVISRLNREGRLEEAPPDFVALLSHSLKVSQATLGLHDPTIQPVWKLYFNHFIAANPDPDGPSPYALEGALSLVDWRGVHLDEAARRVAFDRPGMQISLNSGAQGYITDRVGEVLRAHGFESMLVNMGEERAYAPKPDGSPWRLGLANPADPAKAVYELDLQNKAVATSGGYGTLFDAAGRFTHIIHPRTGQTAPRLLGVSVVAPTAAAADCLAASMILVPPELRADVLRAAGAEMAIYVTPAGVADKVEA
ncbi:thiamine biosynthesis lipoprotein ApbE precursor [mine drainage metagenome]|uniref:FAD:protein FMN transferase n=1 Tax=mine drainage metagenome TaxID=410659 RepID=A0A1J5QCN4_9ZZZZ